MLLPWLRSRSSLAPLSLLTLLLVVSHGHAQHRIAPGPVQINVRSAADQEPVESVTIHLGGRYGTTTRDGVVVLDGVPAGTYHLVAEPYAFERHEREVVLPPGAREPITVDLVPVAQVRFSGRVTLEGHGGPVAGAGIALIPADVRAAVQGRYDFTTNLDGEFTVLEAPEGAYRLELSAAGAVPSTIEVSVAAGMDALDLTLTPEVRPASAQVAVRDAVTGAPVQNAWVTLAEAWPRGILGRANTGPDGNARFANLQTGQLNWETLTEQEGFAGVWLTDRGALEIRAEGNAVRGRFTHGSGRLEGTISGDGATLTGRWAEAEAYEGPVWSGAFTLTLSDDRRTFRGTWGRDAEDTGNRWNGTRAHVSTVDVAPTEVMVHVQTEGYAATAVPMRLGADASATVRMVPARTTAEQEPNNDPSTAQEILPGAPVRFTLHPAGDEGWFRFRLGTTLDATIMVGPDNQRSVNLDVLTPAGDQVAHAWNLTQADLILRHYLTPGLYLLHARQRGGAASEAPLTLRVMGDPLCDVHAPNDTIAQARPIQPGRQVRGYFAPPGDVDLFRLDLRHPSTVHLSVAPGDVSREITLLDRAGETVSSAWNVPRVAVNLEAHVQAGRYYARVAARGNNASPDPYSLWLRVMEGDGHNDATQIPGRIATTRTLQPGTVTATTTLPVGDANYYRVPIPGPGRLKVRSVADVSHEVHILGPAGEELSGSWQVPNVIINQSHDAEGPTTWTVRTRARGGNYTTSPHVLTAIFEPADEIDSMGRNDSPERATPIEFSAPMRGSVFPARDEDWYSLDVDHPGLLRVSNTAPTTHELHVFDPRGDELEGTWQTSYRTITREVHVLRGTYLVRARGRGDNSHPGQYNLLAELFRAEGVETIPLAQDPVRQLNPGEGQTWRPDHPGDVDRFSFTIPQETEFTISIWGSATYDIRLHNALTGEELVSAWTVRNQVFSRRFQTTGPTQYRLELAARGDSTSTEHGYVMVDLERRRPPAVSITPAPDPYDPTNVTFTTEAVTGMGDVERVELDATGNGTVDLRLPAQGEATWRYPAEGLYKAVAVIHGTEGTVTRKPLWVDVRGPRERTGVVLMVDAPSEGQTVDRDIRASARAMSYSGARITRVEATLDGRSLSSAYSAPYTFDVPWRNLTAAEHLLRVTAIDAAGESASVERRFSVSEYFDLTPNDGAVVTGNQVRVSWNSGAFTPTVVRYRPQGEENWQEAVGESGRGHAVLLRDLEGGVTYEIQPMGGLEPGPVRTVTRVKGLAFGSAAYGPTIDRDYDQRFPISVRNHAEESMMVRLVCGDPGTDELLVGFVEEGHADRPFELAPGEERHFVLSLNAQDANQPRYRFPVRIQSDAGYADEAEVQVAVRLPVVDLAWEELGATEAGLGTRLRLTNNGDSLTDLTVRADTADISLSPGIEHGLLPARRSVEITAYPRLYDGFNSVTGTLTAAAVGQSSAHEVTMTVPEGQSVHLVMLSPEAGADQIDPDDQDLLLARAMSAATLNPAYIQPSDWTSGTDTTGDGRLNRWVFVDELERILWVGEDTLGDGEIDFVSADVGFDGQFDYAAIRGENAWKRTNILDVYVETSFTHPRQRSSYDPYDVDIVLNGVLVGELRDTVPEGNHRFRIPPTALSFSEAGVPAGNVLEVRSRRMNRGSYGMSSDFQVKTRLTTTPVWAVAASREEAIAAVRQTPGLMLNEPDYSIASNELALILPEDVAAGAVATLTVPVRNLGVAPGGLVPVALSQAAQRGAEVEIQRQYLPEVPVNGTAVAQFQWSLAAGNQRLKVTVDPDEETDDAHRANNHAYIWVDVPGDDSPPTVEILSPTAGATLTDPVTTIRARARDDVRVARVEVSVNGGLWTPLAWDEEDRYSATALLQPGAHTITVRATDGAGNSAVATANVTVTSPVPDIEILEPGADSSTPLRHADVRVRCGDNVALVAVRVNEGPWEALRVVDGSATDAVALVFGANALEVKAVSPRGVERVERVTVTCTTQRPPEPEEEPADDPEDTPPPPAADEEPPPDTVDIDGFGTHDVKDDGNVVLPPAPGQPITPPGSPEEPVLPDEDVELEEPELPVMPEEVHPELDAQENGAVEEGAEATVETEEYDGAAPEGEPADEQVPLDDLLSEYSQLIQDYLNLLAEMYDPDALPDPEGVEENEFAPDIPLPPSGLGSNPPAGSAVGLQHTQHAHHCTNRPNIQMGFRLPDWLMVLELPEPGTEEYDAMVERMLQRLRDMGMDTEAFERFQQHLRRRARTLEGTDELPTFLQSLGLAAPPTQDPEELRKWREAMLNRTDAFWLRLLASGDPELIYQGLRARASAFGKWDQALQLSAEAAMTQIRAHQTLTEDILRSLPYAGTAVDILALARGESLTGEKLTAGQVAMMGAFRLGPAGLKAAYSKAMRTANGRMFFQALGEMGTNLGDGGVRNLARVLGRSEAEIRATFSWAADQLTRERTLRGGWNGLLGRKAQAAGRSFVPMRAGQEAMYRQRIDRRVAQRFLDRMSSTTDPREFRRMVVRLQTDKTAQALINSPRYTDALRAKANTTKAAMGRLADRHTARAIQNLPPEHSGLQRVLRRNPGLSPDNVTVRARTISGRRAPGDPVSFGRDRDVWYEFVDRRTGRRLGDVHHSVSGDIYNSNIQRITGRSARDLDHTVTSWWHPDAYATGHHAPGAHGRAAVDIASGQRAGQLARARDVADTTRLKPNEWFHDARAAGDPITRSRNVREGMRQAIKEYDRHVKPYLQGRGMGPDRLPPRLRNGLDIFRQVQGGVLDDSMTTEQAARMLQAMGATPETIVDDLAQMVLFVNLWGL